MDVTEDEVRQATAMRADRAQAGVEEMQDEIVSLRHELGRLRRLITPLTAIAELSLTKKRMQDSQDSGGLPYAALSEEDKEKRVGQLNPQLVLNNLADFVNG